MEELTKEEMAALRLRNGEQTGEYIADATWHGLYERGYLERGDYGARLTAKAQAALEQSGKEQG